MSESDQKFSRREFIKKSLGGLGAAALGSNILAGTEQKIREQPNIIFLLTDDQRWDTMGCMGNEIIKTPNMDNLAQEGTLFKNAFVTTAICGASRASILTGQYERRHGCVGFGRLSDRDNEKTYPLMLKDKGYRIGFIGKYGVFNPPVEKYDYWKAMIGQPKYEHTDENGDYKHYTKICEENALEFLEGNDNKPFCLSVSFKAPHVQDKDPRQFIFDPAYQDLYKDVKIPPPKTGADKYYYGAFPDWFTKSNEARRRWRIRFSTPEKYQESVKGYYRLIYGVDVVIGNIRKKLEEIGEADNTVIVLMGDNGFYLGEHGIAGKWYGHEESIRVPLILYDPRLPKSLKGQEYDEMALNVDIAPTLLDLADIQPSESMQGRSLLPLIKRENTEWRKEFFYEHRFKKESGKTKIPPSEGVRTKRYKYLTYLGHNFEELYDLKNDPHEINNLAQSSDNQNLLEKMRAKHRNHLQKVK
jgi:arylsulfatase A-like enzyme